MTERALPAIGVGARTRPHAGGDARRITRPGTIAVDRPIVAKREAILSTPARAGMLLGATAAVYAVSLVGVSALQSQSEAAVAAARAPYLDDLAATRVANNAMEARIGQIDAEIGALIATYGEVATDVSDFQARLDSLAALVADVQGSAAALPNRIKLPSVSTVRISRSSGGGGGSKAAPATGGNTGASGG